MKRNQLLEWGISWLVQMDVPVHSESLKKFLESHGHTTINMRYIQQYLDAREQELIEA